MHGAYCLDEHFEKSSCTEMYKADKRVRGPIQQLGPVILKTKFDKVSYTNILPHHDGPWT